MADVMPSDVIGGVVVVEPTLWTDPRGFFAETFRQEWLPEGSPLMVQGNRADRRRTRSSGCTTTASKPTTGTCRSVACSPRCTTCGSSSPTRGRRSRSNSTPWRTAGSTSRRGVAHGFYAITDATITYLVDNYYNPADELGVAWDDPALGIDWPCDAPILSDRDRANPRIADIPADIVPH